MTAHDTSSQPTSVVDCALYEYGRRLPGQLPLGEAMDAARTTPGAFVWIGLHDPTADQLQVVARAFGLHLLAVEDALEAHQRPKLERYDDRHDLNVFVGSCACLAVNGRSSWCVSVRG